MPQWVKIVMISLAAIVVLIAAGSYLVARQLKQTFKTFEQNTTAAGDAGKAFGRSATLDACVKEVVRRADASDSPFTLVATTPFAWGCLETAPYDSSFCDGMPAMENEPALRSWATGTCQRHGASSENELCPLALLPVAGYCSDKRGGPDGR